MLLLDPRRRVAACTYRPAGSPGIAAGGEFSAYVSLAGRQLLRNGTWFEAASQVRRYGLIIASGSSTGWPEATLRTAEGREALRIFFSM